MSPILIICACALGLLTFALRFNVSLARNRLKDGHSSGDNPASQLMKAVRAHANAAEYIGVIIGLFVVAALVYAGRDPGIAMTVIVIAITLARFSHAIGMLSCKTLEAANPFRFAGALGTYLFGFALSGMLIAKAVL